MKNSILVGFAIIIMVVVYGCASTPGHISVDHSKFDNSTQVTMSPAWLYNSPIKLALFWNSKMPENQIVLVAYVKGAYIFDTRKSLQFNVDGTITSFTSIDDLTDIKTTSGYAGSGMYVPPANFSSKRYIVSNDFIKNILMANEVMVRINLEKSSVEGEFSRNALITAKPAFQDFYNKVMEIESPK